MAANRVTSAVGARLPFVTAAIAQPVIGSAHASVLKLPACPKQAFVRHHP
jgi:hypothetical protein